MANTSAFSHKAQPYRSNSAGKTDRKDWQQGKELADGPVSRILCRAQTAKQPERAAIIPLGHGSHRDSSSLPEGFPSAMACATAKGERLFA
jgi:hypothetical protein